MKKATLLVLLAVACGPRPNPGPEAADLAPLEVGRAFAAAVLEQASYPEAVRWSEPGAALDVRSQVGFLAGSPRKASYSVDKPRQEDGTLVIPVPIESLDLGSAHFRGRMLLHLSGDGRRVRASSLELLRSDGVGLSL